MRYLASGGRILSVLFALLCTASAANAEPCTSGNILQKIPVSSGSPIERLALINDGIATGEGQPWNSPMAATFKESDAPIVFSLSTPRRIQSLGLQADNNDEYHIDGQTEAGDWIRIWIVPTVDQMGLQTRRILFPSPTPPLKALRVWSRSGDERQSISELYASCDTNLPDPIKEIYRTPETRFLYAETAWLLGLIAALAATAVKPLRRGWIRWIVAGYVLLHSGYLLYLSLTSIPLSGSLLVTQRTMLALGGIFTAIATTTIVRDRAIRLVTFGSIALLALCNYLQFGQAQLESPGGRTWSHTYDLRNYYPAAKYFNELGYDGVYLASLAAYEDLTGLSTSLLSGMPVRDLSTLEMRFAEELAGRVTEIRGHFMPARWIQFRDDMRYFLQRLGSDGYLRSMEDHGANATPTWMFFAHLLFRLAPASDGFFTLAGALDLLLIAGSFVAIARVFGVRSALLVAIVFGTSDLPYFSASWLGATLRYDWFAAIALGLCALKWRWFTAAGILLAISAMIRVFPLFAALGILIPLGYAAFRRRQSVGARIPLMNFTRSALCTVLILAVLPIISFGFEKSWGSWLTRIERHDSKSNANSISWRMVVSFDPGATSPDLLIPDRADPWSRWQMTQAETLQDRSLLYRFGQVLAAIAILLLALRAQPHQAAILGLLLVPVFTNPSQYYLHYIALIPLLFSRRSDRAAPHEFIAAALLLLFAVLQYFARQSPNADVCYAVESAALLFMFATITTVFSRYAVQRVQHRRV